MPIDVSHYISGAGDSTSRARRVFAVMISAAVLLICAYANAYAGFGLRRLSAMEAALDYRASQRKTQNQPGGFRAAPQGEGSSLWSKFVNTRRNASEEAVEKMLSEDARRLRDYLITDAQVVSIPLVDIKLEVGDLWILAGLGFSLLQVALIYAIAREQADTQTALTVAAETGDRPTLRMTYELLAMRQLFTVPPALGTRGRRHRVWQLVPKVLFWLPPAAQAFGLFVGVGYMEAYQAESGSRLLVVRYWPELLVLCGSILLSVQCLKLESGFDSVWHKFSSSVPIEPVPGSIDPAVDSVSG